MPTTFEVGTALTFEHFARNAVEVAVVEVGTGGRFDATNLVDTRVAVIAPVSYDHTQTLGSTLTSIGWHKAGIMRIERPAVSAPQSPEALSVIESEARLLRTDLSVVGRDWTWSPQETGMRVASRATRTSSRWTRWSVWLAIISATTPRRRLPRSTPCASSSRLGARPSPLGCETVDWPGRLQVLARQPLVVLDGAHNAASAEVVRHALETDFSLPAVVAGRWSQRRQGRARRTRHARAACRARSI